MTCVQLVPSFSIHLAKIQSQDLVMMLTIKRYTHTIYYLYFPPLSFFHSELRVKFEQAELIDMTNDHYTFVEVSATKTTATDIPVITTNVLSIDELLDTVCSFSLFFVRLLSLFI